MILSAPAVVFSQHDGYGDEHALEAIEAHSNEHVEETRDEAHTKIQTTVTLTNLFLETSSFTT